MTVAMRAIGDIYVAATAVVTGEVVMGQGTNLWFGVVVRGDVGKITMGKGVNLQDGVIVHTDTGEAQDIEDGVVVGHGAILHGRRIGRDSLIGMGAVLLCGCEVGADSLVAAGTVVPEGRRFPPRSLIMGMPAKVLRIMEEADLERTRRIGAHYQELAHKYAAGAFPPPWQPK